MSNPRDGWYPQAARLEQRLQSSGRTLVTSNLVVAESHALIVRRCGHRAGLAFLLGLDEPVGEQSLVWADDELTASARLSWIEHHADKSYSLTDAVSFEIMKREGIHEAFAFDLDFERAGFRLLGGT